MEELRDWLNSPETMGAEAIDKLSALIKAYPYCSAFRILHCIALANTHSTLLMEKVRQTASVIPDRQKFFQQINNGEYEWIQLMNQLEAQKKQETKPLEDDFLLIDQYLDSIYNPAEIDTTTAFDISSFQDEDDDLNGIPSDSEDETLSLIDSFLEEEQQGKLFVPQAETTFEDIPETEPAKIKEKAFLTESLAKLYVKQHKFEQALAIFSSLNLDYSKKNSYFADQIRYLEKVIELQKERNNK